MVGGRADCGGGGVMIVHSFDNKKRKGSAALPK